VGIKCRCICEVHVCLKSVFVLLVMIWICEMDSATISSIFTTLITRDIEQDGAEALIFTSICVQPESM
jgi:hypothetical protein